MPVLWGGNWVFIVSLIKCAVISSSCVGINLKNTSLFVWINIKKVFSLKKYLSLYFWISHYFSHKWIFIYIIPIISEYRSYDIWTWIVGNLSFHDRYIWFIILFLNPISLIRSQPLWSAICIKNMMTRKIFFLQEK